MLTFSILLLGVLLVTGRKMNRCKMLVVPSSQLYPTVIVPLGKNATIKCNDTFSAKLPVSLVKNGKKIETPKGGFRSHIFSIANVSQEHGGLYKCFCGPEAYRDAYGRDEAVEHLIRIPYLPRPRVSFGSVEVGIGKDFTIHCRVQGEASKFYFQKDGKQIPHQHPFEIKITIQRARKEHAGNYSCSYSLPFLMSEPSDPEELTTDTQIPRPTTSSNSDEESRLTIPIAIGVCATLLFLFLLLFLGWYKRRRDALLEATETSGERSFRVLRAHWRAKPTGTSTAGEGHMEKQPPKDDSFTQPKDIIYAELRKTSSDSQEEAEPDNDVVYTTVIVH
ncbi:leukocyte immunoglobulin-like receptor subfamily B member 2 [Sceloporus undulatus]|uniref:leukocyte immunoglobulin-like receptor subfamily B member 2 n=1 Tax=Sceloporus undulatus TaxID=8520 RepID=UPI001C4BA2EF|nr:leukocyte immunoglobulin-like receptor subfamily B member 2 [Sceloporus undulatus]